MVTYKVSKGHSQELMCRCSYKHGCWSRITKKISVITRIKCACCNGYHREKYFLCDTHIENIDYSLPDRMNITIKRAALADPISKLF
jgi:hypothetical protein